MNDLTWARIRDVFGEAIEFSGAARKEFVRQACDGNNSLEKEIENLLQSHDCPQAFIDLPIVRPGLVQEVADPHMFREGQIVSGRFYIERFLGEGGMGEVYAVADRELHNRVALKTLHPHLAVSPRFAQRFRKEIQLARQVTHPNVCRIFDAGRHEGTPYFTMELLEGETLAQRLARQGRMTSDQAAPIVRQLCDALAAAHRVGVLHRDFKSANVMLVGERAVITDFGLARLQEVDAAGAATTGLAVGTPAYMAPEQIEGRPSGLSVDIYALGVVMYEMVTGTRPYHGSSPRAIAAAKFKEPPQMPRSITADIGPEWEAAILKCLSAQPDQRFSDAKEVAAAIAESIPGTVRRTISLKRLGIVVAAGVLAVAGAFGVQEFFALRAPATPSPETARWYRQGTEALGERSFLKAANLLERAVSLEDGNVLAHARLAEAYAELDMSDKAKDEIIHASALAPNRSKLAAFDAHLLSAAQFVVGREFSRAEQVYRAMAVNAPESEKGYLYLDLGSAAENANHVNEAIGAYRLALQSTPQREAALLHLGRLNARQGRKAEAATQLNEAAQLFQLASNYEGVTETKLELARMQESSNLKEAESLTRSAAETAGLTGNLQHQIRARFELSRIKLLEGNAGESSSLTEEAIGLSDRLHLDNLSVQGLNDLAAVMSRQLKWKEVEALSQRVIQLARRSRSRAGEARALFYLAQARMDLEDSEGALRYLNQALPFYRQGGDSVVLQDALAIKSDLLCMQGRYAEAEADAAEMLKWGETHHDGQTLILALQRAAEPRVFAGDYTGAFALYQRETELERQSGRQAGTMYAVLNQADMLWHLGRYAECTARISEAKRLLAELGGGARGPAERLYWVEADSLLSQLRLREAGSKAKQALTSSEGGTTARVIAIQTVLALVEARRGHIVAGRELSAKALRTAEAGGSPASISIAKLAVAETAFLRNDPEAGRLATDARYYCLRYHHQESALRALLLQWSIERRNNGAAQELREAVNQEISNLEKLWGPGSLTAYLHRPDIRELIQSE